MNTPDLQHDQSRGTPVVACQNLTKVFRDFWMRNRARAVDSLTFDLYPQEIFGLLGPNGSGKSTTIKVLLGLLRPTRGRVAVFGKPPTDVETKKRIGYLPEESYLYPFLNARETLDYYGKLFEIGHTIRKKRIDELLDMVGLTHVQHRPIREYSKGMQRRIGLAQALINDPDLLILDEPTTGLDPIGTRQVKDLIVQLGRRGKTVLLSSHLLADVEDCVDRMIILYGGKKRDEGTCDSMLVSHERTTIETDALDEDTIAEIDTLLRQRSGGERSILNVSHPRQTLEQKFLDIVEQAKAEHLETAGSVHGGGTAAFLAAEAASGEALISRLTSAEPEPHETQPDTPAPAADETKTSELIEGLLGDAPEAPESSSTPAAAATPEQSASSAAPPRARPAPPAAEVDDSVIDSLLGGDNNTDDREGSDEGSDASREDHSP
ncbi:Efflux ABC transporter, ATP-binding protein [hydrothermal vent metagenome]|uniref:Efflux ABC transporter, ATP-binding protein n=1 Tax=hydrothermal vent metagenome TaxID=652676 RepID=A0A3B1DU45_9ZZZZ